MGAKITQVGGDITVTAETQCNHLYGLLPSVGATQNLMMATLADGVTTIENASVNQKLLT